jgi:hypothetical protein
MQDDSPLKQTSLVENILTHMSQLSIKASSKENDSHMEPDDSPNSNQASTNTTSNMSSPEIVHQMKNPTHFLARAALPPAANLDPSMAFPWQPPPSGLTIRLKPLSPALDILDKKAGLQLATEVQEPLELDEAARLLEQHRQSRMAHVQLSSQRLQAVVGEKNDWDFGEFLCLADLFLTKATVVSCALLHFANFLSLSLFVL